VSGTIAQETVVAVGRRIIAGPRSVTCCDLALTGAGSGSRGRSSWNVVHSLVAQPSGAQAIAMVVTPFPHRQRFSREETSHWKPMAQMRRTRIGYRISRGIVPDHSRQPPTGRRPARLCASFNMAEHVHTDIIGHSTDSSPAHRRAAVGVS
jgi:hypothetical protein